MNHIFLIDYPLGGKQAYLQWVASISPEINNHPELQAIASYDNYYGESPHRLVEFGFVSLEDYEAFMTDADVRSVDEALAEEAGRFQGHVFQFRFDYIKSFLPPVNVLMGRMVSVLQPTNLDTPLGWNTTFVTMPP